MSTDGISIVLVSDYAGGGDQSWSELRETLGALRRQTTAASVEIILSECERFRSALPADIGKFHPGLRVVLSSENGSYALKNAGVAAARHDVVAILDADCAPDPDWIDRLLRAFRERPDAAVVSGRTVYAGEGFLERASALLTRSYLDRGKAGPARFISNNNAAWRREVFLEHPLPTDMGPFAARVQSEAVLRAGRPIYFEPSARVTHQFDGWRMEADIRRNIGYGTILTRLRDRRLPGAWLTRLGAPSIPLVVAGKLALSFGDCLRCRRHFRVRLHELPAVLGLAAVFHVLEAPGMWLAFRGAPVGKTEYR